MTSYWDAATAFEIAVLDKDFKGATDAALKTFKLLKNKSTDHIHSTMQNIRLLVDEKSGWHKVQSREPDSPGSRRAENLFEFWNDYFEVWPLTQFYFCCLFVPGGRINDHSRGGYLLLAHILLSVGLSAI